MESNETTTATSGGLEKLTFLTGTGRHRVQITHFLWWQIGSWTSLEVGLVVGSRLHRIRHRYDRLVLPKGFESKQCHTYLLTYATAGT